MTEEVASISIDPSGAEDGAKKVDAAFKKIETAIDRLARTASSKFDKLSKATQSINKITGPSQGAVNRLNNLSSALQNFRAPNATQVKNLGSLATQIRKFKGVTVPASVRSTLAFLSNYSGPTAASGRNAAKLFAAISKFKPPAGLKESTRQLERMAAAAKKASLAVGTLSTRFVGITKGGSIVNRTTTRMGNNFEQLGKRAGFLENSILRTQYAFGALGGVLAARVISRVTAEIQGMSAAFVAITGSVQQAGVQIEFVKRVSRELSVDFLTASKSFSLFLASTRGTVIAVNEAQDIFEKVSLATRVLNLSVQDTEGVFRALQQIISKGSVQSEELRQQLGDRLPGAFNRMADALGVPIKKLDEMLKKGQITGQLMKDALQGFANGLADDMRPGLEKALNTVNASFARLRNAATFAIADNAEGGIADLIIALNDGIAKILSNREFNTFLSSVAQALRVVGENLSLVAAIMGGFFVASAAKATAGLRLTLFSTTALGGAWTTLKVGAIGLTQGMAALGLAGAATTAKLIPVTAAARAGATSFNLFGAAAIFSSKALTSLKAAGTALLAAWPALLGLVVALTLAYQALKGSSDDLGVSWNELGELTAMAAVSISNLSAQMRQNTADVDANTSAVLRNSEAKLRSGLSNLLIENSERPRFGRETTGQRISSALNTTTGGLLGDPTINRTKQFIAGNPSAVKIISETEKTIQSTTRKLSDIKDVFANPKKYEAAFKEAQLGAANIENYLAGISDAKQYKKAERALEGQKTILTKLTALGIGANVLEAPELTVTGGSGVDPDVGGDDGKKKKKAGDSVVNIQRYTDQLNDLDLATKKLSTTMTVANAKDSFNIQINADALEEGAANYKDFQDTLERANPKRQAEAEAKLTKAFAEQGITTGDLKDKFIQLAKARSLVDRRQQVVDETNQLRLQNQLLEKSLGVIGKGPKAIEEMEIQQELLRVSIEKGLDLNDQVIKNLEVQIRKNKELETQKEALNELDGLRLSKAKTLIEIEQYGAGGRTKDVADRIFLLQEELRLREKYSDPALVNRILSETKANLNLQRSLSEVSEEYEAQINFANDLGAAITDAFRSGAAEGKTFIKSLGDVFKAAKDVVLDFYLFQPLQESLTRLFTGGSSTLDLSQKQEVEIKKVVETTSLRAASKAADEVGRAVEKVLDAIEDNLEVIQTDSLSVEATTVNLSGSLNAELSSLAAVGSSGLGSPIGLKNTITDTLAKPGAGLLIDEVTGEAFDPNKPIEVIGSQIADTIGDEVREGSREGLTEGLNAPNSPFTRLFDLLGFTSKGATQAEQRLGDVFGKDFASSVFNNSLTKGFGKFFGKESALGGVLSKVSAGLGVVSQGFAAFTTGKQIGKSLGLGKVGSNALGGAAAGFSVGGPIGAAIGAVVGGIFGFLKKTPFAYANVATDQFGGLSVTRSGDRGKGKKEQAEQIANAGIALFENFASLSGSTLKLNTNFGSFGQRKGENFYSAIGISGNRPAGVKGVDYIFSNNDDELQFFALREAIKRGHFEGLSENFRTVATNSSATTLSKLNEDLEFVNLYEKLIEDAAGLPTAFGQIRDLIKNYDDAIRKARQLGLAEEALANARDLALNKIRTDFDFDISQGILEFEDPLQAAFNQLEKDYRETVYTASAVGGDLAAVEKLYGLKRKQLLEESLDGALSAIRDQARSLLQELTASADSPLSPIIAQQNAAAEFARVKDILENGGDVSSIDLNTAVRNLLDTSRGVYGSSTDYFSIFDEVTSLLEKVSSDGFTLTSEGNALGEATLPELQSAQQVLDTLPIVAATNQVGAELAKGNITSESQLNVIAALIQNLLNAQGGQETAAPAPASPEPITQTPSTTDTGGGGTGLVGAGAGVTSPGAFSTSTPTSTALKSSFTPRTVKGRFG